MIQCRECERLRDEVKTLTAYIRSHQERRVRPGQFAKELGISLRKLRELFTLGAPITKIQGLVFINPETFYPWLDSFERKARPGIKGHRGLQRNGATSVRTAMKVPKTKPPKFVSNAASLKRVSGKKLVTVELP